MKSPLPQILFFYSCFLLCNISAHAQTLAMTAGSHFVMNGSPQLIMNSTGLVNNGSFVPASGTVNFSGYSDTSNSFISGDSTTTITNLSISKNAYGVAVKSAVQVTNVLTMASGNLYANSNLTLKSTAANTARVAPVPSYCSIAGKVNVERYFPAHRAWRLMTAPQTNAGTINNTWQNAQAYTANRGTYITGPSPTGINGLDASPANNYSLYTYNYSTQKFNVVTNTKTNISTGSSGSADNTGYFIFVRGDRTASNLYVTNCNITTLNSLGNLQTGTQTFTASPVSGNYTLVGNPYASPVDFSTLARTNLINRFYAWDPTLNTLGSFVVLDDLDGDGIYTKSISGAAVTNIIQSTQAFFVQTLAGAPASLTFNESNKSSANNNLIFRPASLTQGLRVNLYLLNADSSVTLADGALAQFSDIFSNAVDLDDAPKISNISEALSFTRNGRALSAERRAPLTINDTLFIQLTQTAKRNYQMEVAGENFIPSGLSGFFQDTYLHTNTPIKLTGITKINFNIASDSSAVANRFRIVFNMQSPLAIMFTTVAALQKNNGIAVQWNVTNEVNVLQYEVEKSIDGSHFIQADITIATNKNSIAAYNWLDTKAIAGINYYRIKSIDRNGIIKYSQVIRVNTDKAASSISIYPNPVTDNVMTLQFSNEPQGLYHLKLINSEGQVVYEKEITVSGNNMAQSLLLQSTLAKGHYELKTKGPSGAEDQQKLIIQ